MSNRRTASKRGQDKQRAEIEKLQRRIAAGGLLDVQSTDFAIDRYVKDYGKRNKPFLRSEIERIGRSVVAVAAIFLRTMPSERALAVRMLADLKKVDTAAKPLRNQNASDFASAFQNPDVGSSGQFIAPIEAWTKIIQLVKELHELRQLVEHFEMVKPLPGRSEMLARIFVMQMREFYERQIGRPASKARAGRLVELMQAAWDDLQFPAIPEGRLGHILETLPR
ncbi:hypothetical protein V1281_005171 [Nitrobacteraceae bacterium AZCC 2161]